MVSHNTSLLSIAPYGFLPPRSGGHQAIAQLHHHLGLLCDDHVISTTNNQENDFAFKLHKVFPNEPKRYIPKYGLKDILKIAENNNITHIICEHPYMSLTAIALSKKLAIPWYSRSHNIEAERFKALGKWWHPILKQYEQYAMQKANGVLFITQEDAQWAIDNYNLNPDKCHSIPFGTERQTIPDISTTAKEKIATQFNIDAQKPWLYFLGALGYQPNKDAVAFILNEIQPRLIQKGIDAEILIAGKGLKESLIQQIKNTSNTHYLGFVPDLNDFLLACNVMLNPVMTGGGIKTKAIEALGYNNTVISSANGAAGISKTACGDKLYIAENYNWDSFADAITDAISHKVDTPNSFYQEYYQGNIAKKLLSIINA